MSTFDFIWAHYPGLLALAIFALALVVIAVVGLILKDLRAKDNSILPRCFGEKPRNFAGQADYSCGRCIHYSHCGYAPKLTLKRSRQINARLNTKEKTNG